MKTNRQQSRIMREAGFTLETTNPHTSFNSWKRGDLGLTIFKNSKISLIDLIRRVAEQAIYWHKQVSQIREYRKVEY